MKQRQTPFPLFYPIKELFRGNLPCHFSPVLFQTPAALSPLQIAVASSSTWDQEVENHVEQGLWKHGACISGFGEASQRFPGYSLYRPFSNPTHSTVRILTPRPHVALHCNGESETRFSICIKKQQSLHDKPIVGSFFSFRRQPVINTKYSVFGLNNARILLKIKLLF